MAPSTLYHCTCVSTGAGVPPAPTLPSSAHAFHPLHALYFCEECDAVRCNNCVSVEVSGYYCPNCLFEVPSASVRAEKNRCARNCFHCPHCRNTLSVVPSDPPESDSSSRPPVVSTIGEPPFFLYCNFCRWDSADVGITFDKPTGLALQLQKNEDSAPESLEFDKLKEYFEPIIRAATTPGPSGLNAGSVHVNPITAAASSALAREHPGLKYSKSRNARVTGLDRSVQAQGKNKEIPEYRARVPVGAGGGLGEAAEVEWLKGMEDIGQAAEVEQRWTGSWTTPINAADLKPLRIPLHSKKSKRCPACRHILIKPEQKAQSVRFKIKLMAGNYLPSIEVVLPQIHPPATVSAFARRSARGGVAGGDEDRNKVTGLSAGKTHAFQLILTNPLYDPITVRLAVQRPNPPVSTGPVPPAVPRRAPFLVSLPTNPFPIAAFAEAWEYEDDEEMFDEESLGLAATAGGGGGGAGAGAVAQKSKLKNVGVLERRANVTKVGGEIMIGKESKGELKFNMQVSYTYRSDDQDPEDGGAGKTTQTPKKSQPEMKTFSFFTVINLGVILPRDEDKDKKKENTDV